MERFLSVASASARRHSGPVDSVVPKVPKLPQTQASRSRRASAQQTAQRLANQWPAGPGPKAVHWRGKGEFNGLLRLFVGSRYGKLASRLKRN